MSPLFDYRLETLLNVARTGSYTAAAQQLFISQPAVSQQIRSLESDLGMPLVERGGRTIELTRAGRDLVGYYARLSIDGCKFVEGLRERAETPLHIGATLSISQFLLPDLLVGLMREKRRFTVQVSNTESLLRRIGAGDIDFALVEGNVDRSAFGFVDLGVAELRTVMGADENEPESIRQMLSMPLFVREKGSGTRAILESWLAGNGYRIQDFKRVVEVGDQTTIIRLLERGKGVSLMYRDLVSEQIGRGSIREVGGEGFRLSHPLLAVFLKGSTWAKDYKRLVGTLLKSRAAADSPDCRPA
ncbi:MAG: LysR family transcriptional regulator [Berryella intestinalis]|uniref:LysR family transcriptional regulator n=1 Tax=Berryella intestinalis TaxID=1531429 RepID=UPI002A502527|nr:LysR family transcriptional regulator [Berryella intestinalis]MDD7369691.1 LysR family transcriptional regulator [Berryella intestinalis]MDY3129465.1 LysR family transcriptional regulator [Berryella intestinalis]